MKASIIFNPSAGTRDFQAQIRQTGTYLQKQGWQINWCETSYSRHATVLARQSSERHDNLAIAVGGDGTINEVMNGLIGSDTALGILPAGTGNVFAAEMHIPTPGPLAPNALKKAADCLMNGQTRRIDVAKATFEDQTVRHFLMWAGIGLDAAISSAFEADKQERPSIRSLGLAGWFVSGFSVLRNFRGRRMLITVDQGAINRRVILTTVNNSQLYGRFWRLAPEAKIDDGLLDVVVMEGYGFRSSIKHVLMVTLGRHTKDPEVHIYHTKKIKIETSHPIPVHLDAENVGYAPVEIEIAPRALKICLPQTAPHYLFTNVDSPQS